MLDYLYRIFENKINEFAFSRNKAIFEISGLCIPYTEHIIKISLFGNDKKYEYDIPKWKDEIYNFIKQASLYYNLKNSKKLKPKDYMDNFFFGLMETRQEVEQNFKKIIKDFLRKGYEIPEEINFENVFKNHNKFVEEILKDFPEIDYDKTINLIDTYLKGAANDRT